MKYESSIFPRQKLSSKKKSKEWKEACVDYIIGTSEIHSPANGGSNFGNMQKNYDLYNGIFDKNDLQYVVNPFNQDDGFPASPQNFNIIKPKIDLLIGEESKNPFRYRVTRTSRDASSQAKEKMKGMLARYMMASVMSGIDEDMREEYQNMLESGEIQPPESIAKFIERDYKDAPEGIAYNTLNYLKEKLNIEAEFVKGFKDLVIAGKEVYYNGIINGEPYMEKVNPMYFFHDNSPDIEFIEDGDWAARKMRMSYTEIYDRLYDKMTEKQLDDLIDLVEDGWDTGNGMFQAKTNKDTFNRIRTRTITDHTEFNNGKILDLWHVTWKSYKKVGFLTYQTEEGEIQETIVSEDYIETGEEISLEWKWIIEVWEGYRVGKDLYAGIGPIEYQHVNVANPNSQKLPYTGIIINNSNTESKSLVDVMKPLQYMYIIIWYRLELAMARDKGKVPVMDITQIPKSMNIDPAKWLHYLSAVGVMFVNPYEEGWDIPGREGGRPSQFNQIQQMDLTMANVIGGYIDLLSKIEDMIGEISGISRQRQGAVANRELVGSIDRSVIQSALVTEPIFWAHSQCKRNALRMLLNTAKEAWRMSGRENIQYVLNDATRVFLDITEDFYYEDFDIFVSDSTKEAQMIESLKSLYQPAMQNGASLGDIASIMTSENITDIQNKLREIEQKRAEMEQQAQEAESQREMQIEEVKSQYVQAELELKRQELELEKYKIDMDNQTRVITAQLNAYRNKADTDSDMDGTPDVMEIANTAIKMNEVDAKAAKDELDFELKAEDSRNKTMVENRKIDIDNKKINLEREKINSQLKLQKMKDDAALEREKIKAATALKNKVVGESKKKK